jgi:GntR family transcriptional regulator
VVADPLYRQIAQDLQRRIEAKELAPGDRLPNELAFREMYGASRNTIRDAIKWLTNRGLVETRPGHGTFVVRRITPLVTTLSADPSTGMAGGEGTAAFEEINRQRERERQARSNRVDARVEGIPEGEPRASIPRVEVQFAARYVAERLRLPEGSEVVSRHQEFFLGRDPWSLQTTFYPMVLVERGAEELRRAKDIEEGAATYLEGALGLKQCGYRVRMLVRSPSEVEARFFSLPDDARTPVVSLIRTAYTDTPGFTGKEIGPYPFRVTFTSLPADRNQFVINSGTFPEEPAAPARDQ